MISLVACSAGSYTFDSWLGPKSDVNVDALINLALLQLRVQMLHNTRDDFFSAARLLIVNMQSILHYASRRYDCVSCGLLRSLPSQPQLVHLHDISEGKEYILVAKLPIAFAYPRYQALQRINDHHVG